MAEWLKIHGNEYRLIVAPNDNWLPIYYLFATRDFSHIYIGKFHDNFQIPQIANMIFTKNICPNTKELSDLPDVSKALILSDGNCDVAEIYEITGTIYRTDGSVAYRLLRLKYIPKI